MELIGLSVIARGMPERPRLPDAIPPGSIPVPASRRTWFPDIGWVDTPVIDRAALATQPRNGPLIVQEYDATCLVPMRRRGHAGCFRQYPAYPRGLTPAELCLPGPKYH